MKKHQLIAAAQALARYSALFCLSFWLAFSFLAIEVALQLGRLNAILNLLFIDLMVFGLIVWLCRDCRT